MAYSTTYDESYNHSSRINVSAGYYDAPSTTNSIYVLANSSTAYGHSADYYTSADIDIYSMGSLAPGLYKIDVDKYTWDWSNAGYGSISSYSLLNGYGAVVDTSYSIYSDLHFTVYNAGTYYVQVVGPSYGSTQYALKYTKIGELPVNVDATSDLSITGELTTGSEVSITGSYNDSNGISNADLTYYWYRAGPGESWTEISGANEYTYTLNSNDIGKYIASIVQFYDDDGFIETLPLTSTAQPVYEANVDPVISTTAIGFNYTSNDYYYDVGAFDGNLSDSISYSMTTTAGWLTINSSTGVIKGSSRNNKAGQYTVDVTATDGRGGSDSQAYTLRMVDDNTLVSTPSLEPFPLTGNNLLDVSLTRFQWDLNIEREINWSISGGFNGEFWTAPDIVALYTGAALSAFADYIDVKFNYVGSFSDPSEAYQQGSGINISMDGGGRFFNSTSAWAIGFFPNAAYDTSNYAGAPGDIFLNLNSQANYLESYAPGSAGWFLLLHELGHTLGLKHTHDSGGTNGPTLAQLNLDRFDNDWFSIMSYEDSLGYNLKEWDPSTPMYLDVLGLQYLYGNNTSTGGDNTYYLEKSNSYYTIYDAGGINKIDVSESGRAWTIDLKTLLIAVPTAELNYAAPKTLYWLKGNFNTIVGSAYADNIAGDDLNNVIDGGLGDDFLYGNGGLDTLKYSFEKAKYNITTTHVTGIEGSDYINSIERIVFSDSSLAFDTGGANSAGGIYRTYKAAFNRTPEKTGFGYWIDRADNGASAVQMAEEFVWSAEFQTLYGVTTSDNYLVGNDIEAVVDLFYRNVLGRAPDQGGLDYYASTIVAQDKTGGRVLAEIADSAENRTNLLPTIENGMGYDLWVA